MRIHGRKFIASIGRGGGGSVRCCLVSPHSLRLSWTQLRIRGGCWCSLWSGAVLPVLTPGHPPTGPNFWIGATTPSNWISSCLILISSFHVISQLLRSFCCLAPSRYPPRASGRLHVVFEGPTPVAVYKCVNTQSFPLKQVLFISSLWS